MDYQTRNALHAEKAIKAALAVLDLPVKGSYATGEVCKILGITERSYWRLIKRYELNTDGNLVRPDCLKTFMMASNRRVTYLELVDFIRRNDDYLKNTVQANPEGEN